MSSIDIEDLSYELNKAARRYGITKMARESDKRAASLQKKLDPAEEAHGLTISEFILVQTKVLEAFGEVGPIETLCRILGGQFTTRHSQTAESLLDAILIASKEQGDVGEAIRKALGNDGVIDSKEKANIKKEIREARKALDVIENVIDRISMPVDAGP
jgi:hypothetical protein